MSNNPSCITRLCSIVIVCAALISGCGSVDINDYQDNKPTFSVSEFFDGQLTAHGIVKDRSGKVIRYFNATLDGRWDEQGIGTLEEDFIFDDGEKQRRQWVFTPAQTQTGQTTNYVATANDVVGDAFPVASGNAFFMEYVLRIQYKGEPLDVTIDDRMYLVNPTTLINESIMSKWGFQVGSFTLVIKKQ